MTSAPSEEAMKVPMTDSRGLGDEDVARVIAREEARQAENDAMTEKTTGEAAPGPGYRDVERAVLKGIRDGAHDLNEIVLNVLHLIEPKTGNGPEADASASRPNAPHATAEAQGTPRTLPEATAPEASGGMSRPPSTPSSASLKE